MKEKELEGLIKKYQNMDNIKAVAHYTSVDNVFSILNSRELWATHYKSLNDKSEIEHAIDCVESRLSNQNRDFFRRNCIGALRNGDENIEFYILSFCIFSKGKVGNNNDGLLSMWRSYGKTDGCAIVFDSKKLDSDWFSIEKKGNQVCFSFQKIYYEQDENIEKLISELDAIINKLKRGCSNNEILLKLILVLTTSIKYHAFFEEQEVRLTVLRNIPALNGNINKIKNPINIDRKLDGSPYVKLNYELEAVKKIIVGPGEKQEKNFNKITHFIKNSMNLKKIEVIKSKIPFVYNR